MKKQKNIEDLTYLDLIEALIYDENIQDNLNVSNDYEPDEHDNSIVTIAFEGPTVKRKKGTACLIIFTFNRRGRMVGVEVATRKKGDRHWQVASSEKMVDFTSRYGSDTFNLNVDSKKKGN